MVKKSQDLEIKANYLIRNVVKHLV